MDLHLSREQEMLRKMYRDFAENEVKPLAEWVDENEAFPEETVKKMAKLGMMGIYFPKEYGGAGADVLSYVMAVEEMSKVCGTTGVIISAHTSLCCAPIYENGTEEQKKYYLPKLCSGEWIGAFGLTEPGAGTDAQGQQTTAVLDEEKLSAIVNECFDMRPAKIIEHLNLRRPIYEQTAAYGHFGRTDVDLPWEHTDMVEKLKSYL